ncbi:MAG: response regulator [Elusimicrobia bacterium]|nr:response regulator [Elusimicrobiota bacterium]
MAEERILIVCGEPARQGLLRLWLEAAGYRNLRSAGSGGEALAWARSEPPDCVVLDGDLPDLSGPELCRRLRGARVVLLAAEPGSRARGLQSGACEVAVRSDSPDELLAALAAALGRPREEPPRLA